MNIVKKRVFFSALMGLSVLAGLSCAGISKTMKGAPPEGVSSGTLAHASSVRENPAQQLTLPRFFGVGKLPLSFGDASAILDGDQITAWWSGPDPRQEVTVVFDAPVSVRSVEIEWGENYPSSYEIDLSRDGVSWETVVRRNGFVSQVGDRAIIAWESHPLDPEVVARQMRIRTLEGEKDGIQIVDIFINERLPFSFEPVPQEALFKRKDLPINVRVEDLLSRMTFTEKVRLTSGIHRFGVPGIERFGFNPVWMSNASQGVKLQVDGLLEKSTAFPTLVAAAATWDEALVQDMGRAIGKECRAGGIALLLGPGVNIQRTSTGGRNFEYFSEDPFLTARMGVSHIKGLHAEGVLAVIKHFAMNNNEFLRGKINALVDERTLMEIYMPGYLAAIEEADLRVVMSAYNGVNGEKTGESPALLTGMLRERLGFTGFVMSDWGGTSDYANILKSGQNLIMPQLKGFGEYLREQRQADPVAAEKALDRMIAPTLRVLLESGVWERGPGAGSSVDYLAHNDLARRIAEAGITLLKNDNVLPLKEDERILIVGQKNAVLGADQGGGSGRAAGFDQVNYLEGLRAVYGANVSHKENPSPQDIRGATAVLYFFNMGDREGTDRPFELPAEVDKKIFELARHTDRLIVLASSGTAFGTPWLEEVQGLVHCYYSGQARGAALAAVLTGKVNPSGKLPFTMEKSFSDSPAFGYNIFEGRTEWAGNFRGAPESFDLRYEEGIFVGYRWYEKMKKPVNFPFGFGLSYTAFKIGPASVSSQNIPKSGPLVVRVDVTNTGNVPGAEVVQLYVHDRNPEVERPYRELKGFRKVHLNPGETQTVEFHLSRKDFAYWDVSGKQWKVGAGPFLILAGNSSRDVQSTVEVAPGGF